MDTSKILLVLFFSSFSFLSHGQHIKGQLRNDKGEAIPYAHIKFIDSSIGTISNDSGFFQLTIPNGFSEIEISSIGYKVKSLSVKSLDPAKMNIIMLNSDQINLQEVVVEGSFDSAGWYMQQAIKRIPKNYSKKRFSQVAFYRGASIRDTAYARMVEAIVLLSEKGINRQSEDTEFEILQLRKTKDNRRISWRQSLSEWLYQDLGPYMVTKSNPTKPKGTKNSPLVDFLLCNALSDDRREKPTRLLYEGLLKENYFTITNRYKMNDTDFIELTSHTDQSQKKNKVKKLSAYCKVIINTKDKAIVQFEKFQVVDNKSGSNILTQNTLHDNIRSHYLIRWQQNKEGTYYIEYIRDASIGSNSSRMSGIANLSEYYLDSNRQSGLLKQINEWYVLETRDYENITWLNEAAHDDDIYDIEPTKRLPFTFDNINAIPINPISPKMLNDLTQNDSLDELFIEE